MGKERRLIFSGGRLIQYFETLKNTGAFTPPLTYEAMKKVPPLPLPRGGLPIRNLHVPDTILRQTMERRSEIARRLYTHGLSSVPWWTENSPIDEAVAEVKTVMKENPHLGLNKAVDLWNKQRERREKVRQREIQLIQEEAMKRKDSATQQGGASTVVDDYDAFTLLKLFKDMQVESDVRREVRLDETIARVTKVMPAIENYPGLQSGAAVSQFRQHLQYVVNNKMKLKQVEEKELREKETLLDISKTKAYPYELEKRLNPTFIRKSVTALEISEIVLQMMKIKRKYDETSVFAATEVTPYDFLSTFIRAFNIYIPADYEGTWEEIQGHKYAFVTDPADAATISDLENSFIDKFLRYSALEEVQLNISGFLSNIDLGFGESLPFKNSGPYKSPLEEANIEPVDITSIVESLVQSTNWGGIDRLKLAQPVIEDFFTHLHTLQFLRQEMIQQYNPLKLTRVEDAADQMANTLEEQELPEEMMGGADELDQFQEYDEEMPEPEPEPETDTIPHNLAKFQAMFNQKQ